MSLFTDVGESAFSKISSRYDIDLSTAARTDTMYLSNLLLLLPLYAPCVILAVEQTGTMT